MSFSKSENSFFSNLSAFDLISLPNCYGKVLQYLKYNSEKVIILVLCLSLEGGFLNFSIKYDICCGFVIYRLLFWFVWFGVIFYYFYFWDTLGRYTGVTPGSLLKDQSQWSWRPYGVLGIELLHEF